MVYVQLCLPITIRIVYMSPIEHKSKYYHIKAMYRINYELQYHYIVVHNLFIINDPLDCIPC